MTARLPARSKTLTIVAFISLIGCLAFAAVRLYQADEDLRTTDVDNYVYHFAQAQYEAARFAECVTRRIHEGLQDPEELQLRYDILLSRLGYFMDGRPAQKLDRLDSAGSIRALHAAWLQRQSLVASDFTVDEGKDLARKAMDTAAVFRDAANAVVLEGREQEAAARQKYMDVLFQSIGSVLGILFGAAVLSLRFYRGIRETRRAQRLLRQEQEFSDLVINLSHQGIIIFDTNLRCLLWNPGMDALLQVESHMVVGRPLVSAVPLFERPEIESVLRRATRGESGLVECEGAGSDHERCIEISCHPLRMSERDLVIAFARDVTERWQARKRAERHSVDLQNEVKQRTVALRQAESRLIAAIKAAPDGFAAFDSEGKLLIANERIRSLDLVTGCYRDDMSLHAFLSCFAICEGADERLLAAPQPFLGIELDLKFRKDYWAHLSVTQVDGGLIFVRLTDVTAYKQAAHALQSALDREREMTSAYRSFVSMVSHQFRTPLAIVDSSAQRLLRQGPDVPADEIAARMGKIRNATSRLTRLVDSVLNAARLDDGQIELNPSDHDLVRIVSDLCERQRELNPQIAISLIAPDQPLEVRCDGMLIEQVVGNLLSNAVKYSGGATSVEVHIASEGEMVSCSVRDWGIGIPADELGKVFNKFFRARTATGIAGTGIGLNVARQIVQMHGGDIRVESREAEGSVFTFTLPFTSADQAPRAA
jgi:PAS domain S-box-containing protein